MTADSEERATIRREFADAVNMTRAELIRWLESPESGSAGMTPDGEKKADPGGTESVGHASGRRIVDLLATKQADLGDDDYAHMRTVVGFVRRHLAQRPHGEDLADSRWRASLRNWGHDPLKS